MNLRALGSARQFAFDADGLADPLKRTVVEVRSGETRGLAVPSDLVQHFVTHALSRRAA